MSQGPNPQITPPRTALAEERWAWGVEHAAPASDDDTPILMDTAGRRASREELLAFVAREQERIARGG